MFEEIDSGQNRRPVTYLIGIWFLCCINGMAILTDYAITDTPTVAAPRPQPLDMISAEKHTLLVFLHPKCPCSQASVRQLGRIMARCQDQLIVDVYFYRPLKESNGWAQTNLWNAARRIPGVAARIDPDGKMAKFFKVNCSGHAVLYDTRSQLQFSGGLTAGRGHEGDSTGSDAVIRGVRDRHATVSQTPVFGCRLYAAASDSALERSRP